MGGLILILLLFVSIPVLFIWGYKQDQKDWARKEVAVKAWLEEEQLKPKYKLCLVKIDGARIHSQALEPRYFQFDLFHDGYIKLTSQQVARDLALDISNGKKSFVDGDKFIPSSAIKSIELELA